MTIDTIAHSAEEVEQGPGLPPAPGFDRAARSHLFVSFLFLAESLLAGLVLAIQLVEPDLFEGIGFLSYGRLQPLATHMFVYGWVTMGLLGAAYYVVRRVSVRTSGRGLLAGMSFGLLTTGYVAGAVGIAVGQSEGRRLLEAPLWADAVVLLGLLAAASVISGTVRRATDLGPAQWYLTAGVWWLVLLHVVGNIPGLTGVPSALQTSFYRAGLMGLWMAAAGVGVVYYLIPRLTGRSGFVPTQMSVIGLWSLGFVWALTAPSDLTYGPGPDWLDTISVIFGVGMAIPVAVIFADMVTAMRGRWHDVSDATSMRYVMAGAVALALIPVVNLMVALRGTSAIVGFTDWLGAVEFLAVGVAATFWLLAYLSVAGPDLGRGGPPSTRWPYLVTVLGAMVFIAGLLLGGLQVGLTWLGGANTPGVVNTGNGFETSAEALQGVYVLRLVGYAIYAYGLVWFMARFVLPGRPDGPPVPADASQPPEIDADLALRVPLRYRKLVVGAVALFGLAVGLALVLPSLEADEATLLAERSRSYADGTAVAEGREVYLREGCHVCHTQVVRPIISDVGLGAVSQQGDYSDETPALIGSLRIGPDLMHVASRVRDDADGGDTAAFVASHLSDPRQLRPWSIMPAYDYLSAEDLGMLVAYIVSLD